MSEWGDRERETGREVEREEYKEEEEDGVRRGREKVKWGE